MHIGEKIKRWRKANGVKQAAFAYDIGVSQATVSRWERQIDAPSLYAQRRVNELLETTRSGLDSMLRSIVVSSPEHIVVLSEDLTVLEISQGIREHLPALENPDILLANVSKYLWEPEIGLLEKHDSFRRLNRDIDNISFFSEFEYRNQHNPLYQHNSLQMLHNNDGSSLGIWKCDIKMQNGQSDLNFYDPLIVRR